MVDFAHLNKFSQIDFMENVSDSKIMKFLHCVVYISIFIPGAVEGPSEFAEGLVIGVRSVFSGVVGGAAGTVSKITGAFGKGFAFLTFDEAFKRRRNEAIKKRGKQTLAESVARSSKGLAMGIFEGKRYWIQIGQCTMRPNRRFFFG